MDIDLLPKPTCPECGCKVDENDKECFECGELFVEECYDCGVAHEYEVEWDFDGRHVSTPYCSDCLITNIKSVINEDDDDDFIYMWIVDKGQDYFKDTPLKEIVDNLFIHFNLK